MQVILDLGNKRWVKMKDVAKADGMTGPFARYFLIAQADQSVLAKVSVPLDGRAPPSVSGNGDNDPYPEHGMAIEILSTLIDADLPPTCWTPRASTGELA